MPETQKLPLTSHFVSAPRGSRSHHLRIKSGKYAFLLVPLSTLTWPWFRGFCPPGTAQSPWLPLVDWKIHWTRFGCVGGPALVRLVPFSRARGRSRAAKADLDVWCRPQAADRDALTGASAPRNSPQVSRRIFVPSRRSGPVSTLRRLIPNSCCQAAGGQLTAWPPSVPAHWIACQGYWIAWSAACAARWMACRWVSR